MQHSHKTIKEVEHKSPIAREYNGYIILAQNEKDYISKCIKIDRGDRLGFYKYLD